MFFSGKVKMSDHLLLPLFYNAYFCASEDLAILKYEQMKKLFDFLEVE